MPRRRLVRVVEDIRDRVSPETKSRAVGVCSSKMEASLANIGFQGSCDGWFVRRGPVDQVLELQHALYGPRITLNLGLNLPFLLPVLRWIPRSQCSPHAHECHRWLRIGFAHAGQSSDRWWNYEPENLESYQTAASALATEVETHALAWLEGQSAMGAFLEHAVQGVERSKNATQPEGGFLELRVMAAVLAWNGKPPEAWAAYEAARKMWPKERPRIEMSKAVYARRHPEVAQASVPALDEELHEVIAELLR